MNRTLAFVALALLLAGCTRYGTRLNGPFARHTRPNSNEPVPPELPRDKSPLAIGSPTRPDLPPAPDDLTVPPRARGNGTDPGADIAPAGGVAADERGLQLRPRRNPPQPGQLPSPFAPKGGAPNPQPDQPQPAQPQPAVDPSRLSAAQHVAEVKKLAALAAEQWSKVNTYEAVVTRRELPPRGKMSEDVVLYQFRKEPMAVYIRNIGEAGKGRELLYFPSKHDDKIYCILGAGDGNILLKDGSKAPPVSPDSPLVKDKSRYSIREAGYGTPIARVANWAAKAEAGKIPAEALKYLGPVNRPEFKQPVAGVQLRLRPGDDPLLPTGGTRQWFFETNPESPAYGFPVLIIATEANGKEVEYYLFEKLRFGVPLTDADFDPNRLMKKR
jgi:hypothetical protein